MAATKLYLQGEIEWAKVFEQNRDKRGPNGAWEDRGGACTIVLWLDKENQKKFNESGSRMSYQKAKDDTGAYEVKVDDQGRKALQLRRYWINEKFPNYGGAPEVNRIDGTEWDLEEDGLIGNGSVGIVCATIYDTATGKGTRLEGVQVLEHVEFKSEGGSGGGMFQDRSGGAKKEGKTPPKPAPAKTAADLDDEIPF